jgi:HSP20 family protein
MMTLRYRDEVMDNVWKNFFNDSRVESFSPVYDVVERESGYELSFEMPGIEEDDISIEVKDRNLTLEVKRAEVDKKVDEKEVKESVKEFYLMKSRKPKFFKKAFNLPEDVDSEAVTAGMKLGILTLNIGKKEQVQPKRITINS